MIQYILECIAFQLVFLLVYDLFLKRETFFQWNRLYLIGTYLISLVLPWIKIEALKTQVPERLYIYPDEWWNMNNAAEVAVVAQEASLNFSWSAIVFLMGVFLSFALFTYKLAKLYALRKGGELEYYNQFTKVVLKNSDAAFSFFKSIFLGDRVLAREHQNIIDHELVHIRQNHTYDLLFFEFMRIISWFNPLVYVYQNRLSELHEFIADAEVAKNERTKHCELLLSQAFQSQNISFINQFFKSSLIKKRIVMLQKAKSGTIWKLKYLALLPVLLGMLVYTSCERDLNENTLSNTFEVDNVESLTPEEEQDFYVRLLDLSKQGGEWKLALKDDNSTITFTHPDSEYSYISGPNGVPIKAAMKITSKVLASDFDIFEHSTNSMVAVGYSDGVPFSTVDEVPVFPGCENASDPRACFQQSIQKHISKNFRYPDQAQTQGIEGRVSVMFTISEDGSITDIRKRGPHPLLEEETERIIARLPQMKPGKQRGQAVRVPFSIPITFKLESSSSIGLSTSDKSTEERMSMDEVMANTDAMPFATVEKAPVFPGCENASDSKECFKQSLYKHVSKHFRYPEDAQARGIQGRVAIMFTIAEDGSIQGIRYRGPDPSLEQEALRIIKKLPQMQPAQNKSKSVAVAYSVPITFKLQGPGNTTSTSIDSTEGPNLKPLVYVDGVETSYEQLEKMNPDQIASMNVLKDEVAVEKYGDKGENGVIEILTKGLDGANQPSLDQGATLDRKLDGKRKQIVIAERSYNASSGEFIAKATDGYRPLPGVNIVVKGRGIRTVSDFDGNFTLNVQKNDVLEFQYLNYPLLSVKMGA